MRRSGRPASLCPPQGGGVGAGRARGGQAARCCVAGRGRLSATGQPYAHHRTPDRNCYWRGGSRQQGGWCRQRCLLAPGPDRQARYRVARPDERHAPPRRSATRLPQRRWRCGRQPPRRVFGCAVDRARDVVVCVGREFESSRSRQADGPAPRRGEGRPCGGGFAPAGRAAPADPAGSLELGAPSEPAGERTPFAGFAAGAGPQDPGAETPGAGNPPAGLDMSTAAGVMWMLPQAWHRRGHQSQGAAPGQHFHPCLVRRSTPPRRARPRAGPEGACHEPRPRLHAGDQRRPARTR